MNLRQYLDDNRGAAQRLARQLSVTPQSVWGWSSSKQRVPAERVLQIWELTDKAVHPSEMRPDIYPVEKIRIFIQEEEGV